MKKIWECSKSWKLILKSKRKRIIEHFVSLWICLVWEPLCPFGLSFKLWFYLCFLVFFVSSSLSLQMLRNFVKIIQIVKTHFIQSQHSNSTLFDNMSNSCTRPIEYAILKWYFTTYFISYDHDCAIVNEHRWTEKNLHLIN